MIGTITTTTRRTGMFILFLVIGMIIIVTMVNTIITDSKSTFNMELQRLLYLRKQQSSSSSSSLLLSKNKILSSLISSLTLPLSFYSLASSFQQKRRLLQSLPSSSLSSSSESCNKTWHESIIQSSSPGIKSPSNNNNNNNSNNNNSNKRQSSPNRVAAILTENGNGNQNDNDINSDVDSDGNLIMMRPIIITRLSSNNNNINNMKTNNVNNTFVYEWNSFLKKNHGSNNNKDDLSHDPNNNNNDANGEWIESFNRNDFNNNGNDENESIDDENNKDDERWWYNHHDRPIAIARSSTSNKHNNQINNHDHYVSKISIFVVTPPAVVTDPDPPPALLSNERNRTAHVVNVYAKIDNYDAGSENDVHGEGSNGEKWKLTNVLSSFDNVDTTNNITYTNKDDNGNSNKNDGSYFGFSIAAYGDIVIIGSPYSLSYSNNSNVVTDYGMVHVYKRRKDRKNKNNDNFSEREGSNPPQQLDNDNEQQQYTNSEWIYVTNLCAPSFQNNEDENEGEQFSQQQQQQQQQQFLFGSALAIHKDTIVVSSGIRNIVYVYNLVDDVNYSFDPKNDEQQEQQPRNKKVWRNTGKLLEPISSSQKKKKNMTKIKNHRPLRFGHDVAVRDNVIVVGCPSNDDNVDDDITNGKVYVYVRSHTNSNDPNVDDDDNNNDYNYWKDEGIEIPSPPKPKPSFNKNNGLNGYVRFGTAVAVGRSSNNDHDNNGLSNSSSYSVGTSTIVVGAPDSGKLSGCFFVYQHIKNNVLPLLSSSSASSSEWKIIFNVCDGGSNGGSYFGARLDIADNGDNDIINENFDNAESNFIIVVGTAGEFESTGSDSNNADDYISYPYAKTYRLSCSSSKSKNDNGSSTSGSGESTTGSTIFLWLVLGLVIMVASCVIIDRRIGSPGLWWVTLWLVCRRRRKKVSSGYDGASDNDRGGTRNYHLGSSAVTYDLSSRVPPSQTCRSGDDRFIDEDANISNNSNGNVEMPRMY